MREDLVYAVSVVDEWSSGKRDGDVSAPVDPFFG